MMLFSVILSVLLAAVARAQQKPFNHPAAYAANIKRKSDSDSQHALKGNRWGNFVLVNQCDYDVYVWRAHDGYSSEMMTVKARSPLREQFGIHYTNPTTGERCTNNCGLSYKVSQDTYVRGGISGNHVQLEYSSKDGILYYDISFVDCAKNLGYRTGDASNCPGWREGIHINGPDDFKCEVVDCAASHMCIGNKVGAYYIDEPKPKWGFEDPVGTCPSIYIELYFRLCSRNPDLPRGF